VRFIPGAELAAMPDDANGWCMQQVLKIKVIAIIRSERYVLLGQKPPIQPARVDFLENEAGLSRLNGHSHVDPPMQDFEGTLLYLGADSEPHIKCFTRTTTPFTILSSEARDLIRYLEDWEGKPFASAFLEKHLTEFFLERCTCSKTSVVTLRNKWTNTLENKRWTAILGNSRNLP
jgi:hypothetical protein